MKERTAASVFSDEVISAAGFSEHAGRVLDRAAHHPVTITRADEAFALLRRDHATHLAEAARHLSLLVGLLQAVETPESGGAPEGDHPYGWVAALEASDRRQLMAEVTEAIQQALAGSVDWSEVDVLLHEWEESGAVLQSEAVATAFAAFSVEVPLSVPAALLIRE